MESSEHDRMPPAWRTFLMEVGAVIDGGRVQHFGNPVRELKLASTGILLTDLSHDSVACVHGADAVKFLQGQFTNDIAAVTEAQSQLSAYCNPKGRTLALTRFFQRDARFCMILPATLMTPTLARLRKYVLMSKVTIETPDDWVHIAYADPRDGAHLRAALGQDLPTAANAVVHAGGLSVIRVPGAQARFEIVGELAAVKTLWQTLYVHAAAVGAGVWDLLDIQAGLPNIYPETVEAFVPQMINLDLLGAISFKKGCYTGQEVVARTHYLGKVKRRMHRLFCHQDLAPPPGTALFHSDMRADESAGTVVRAQAVPGGGCELLAVLPIEAATQGELHLETLTGPLCQIRTLPYSLDAGA